MQKIDLQNFEKLLNEISDCYDRKHSAPTAIKHWFEALIFHPWVKVEAELRQWLRSKSKFPTIAEIVQPLNEKALEEREIRLTAEKQKEKSEVFAMQRTADGRKIISEINAVLANRNLDYKHWAKNILEKHANGQDVLPHSLKCACEALRVDINSIRKAGGGVAI
jgi:hypothetical protein